MSTVPSLSFPPQNVPFGYDASAFPLVGVQVRRFETYDLTAHFGQMMRFLREGPVAFVYDIRGARVLSFREAQLFASLFRVHGEGIRRSCLGAAIISECPLQRGVLTTIDWMCPIPFSVKAFGCPKLGEEWVRELLEDWTRTRATVGPAISSPRLET